MRRALAVLGAVLWIAGVAAAAYLWRGQDPHAGHAPQASMGAMDATYLPLKGSVPLNAAALTRADGSAFPANGFEGRWTLLFFGFTSCPDVCPTTLDALTRA